MLHIDPPQRRLMVRGPIEQPLIFKSRKSSQQASASIKMARISTNC